MVIHIAIIEDEKVYSDQLKELIEEWADEITAVKIEIYNNGLDFLKKQIQDINKVDVVFIDVQLPFINGMEMAGQLRSMGYNNTIIFTTNYSGRAVDGYSVDAFRYYIKPIQPRDIKESMRYVMNKISNDYFSYKYQGTLFRIPFKDIICFESMNHYIDIFTINEMIHIKALLKEIQPQCPLYFVRCHRSYIVNVNYIRARRKNTLILSNDKVIEVAARYSKLVNKLLENNQGG